MGSSSPVKERTLALLSFGAFIVFLLVAVLVRAEPSLTASELQTSLWANQLSLGEPLNSVLIGASLYGREYFWIGLVAVMFLFGNRRTKLVALGLCGAFVGGIVFGTIAKDVVARARPDQFYIQTQQGLGPLGPIMRIPFDTDYSFPSGHAVIVSIGAVYSLVTFKRKWVAALLTLEALVVCFSRLYTFEHFPTDVAAGFALGASVAIGGVAIEKRYLQKQGGALTDALVRLFRDGPLKV